MTASTTDVLEELRSKERELKERDRTLGKRLYELGSSVTIGGQGALQRERDDLRREIGELNEERAATSRRIFEVRQQRKRQIVDETRASPEYRSAAVDALDSLEGLLAPWAELASLNSRSRELPAVPPSIGLLALEVKEWVDTLRRLGVLRREDVPEGLRELMQEGK